MRLQVILHWIFSRENLWALILCLVVLAVFILSADSSPQWIYQGF
jgi:hypothetical protein